MPLSRVALTQQRKRDLNHWSEADLQKSQFVRPRQELTGREPRPRLIDYIPDRSNLLEF